ncbi:MAG: hypothetical protein Fur0021_12620 [Candidatus Promineifilaceae bacterium]
MPDSTPFHLTRRQFLASLTALGGAYAGRFPLFSLLASVASPPIIECEEGPTANGSFLFDRDNWKRHGVAHFIDVLWPGDNGSLAFAEDESPFSGRLPQAAPNDDPADASAGAYMACAINAFFDPYYTFETQGGNFALVSALDWLNRLAPLCDGNDNTTYFHQANWNVQIWVVHRLEQIELVPLVELWQGAWLLALATTLGAAYNYSVTNDIGWPGPADHYYHGTTEGSHTVYPWLRPTPASEDGNLP